MYANKDTSKRSRLGVFFTLERISMTEKEYKEYLVSRSIEIGATSHEAAAEEALKIQRDQDSIATCFEVAEMSEDAGEFVKIDVALEGTKRL